MLTGGCNRQTGRCYADRPVRLITSCPGRGSPDPSGPPSRSVRRNSGPTRVAELQGRPDNHPLELTGRAVGHREALTIAARPATQLHVRRGKATGKETLMSEKKAPGKLADAKGAQKPTKSTTGKAS